MILSRHNILIHLFVAVVLACALPACSRDAHFSLPEEEAGRRPSMSLTVCLDGKIATSRAAAQGFEDGEGLENYLDIANNNFRIYFFDSDNKFLDVFRPLPFNFDGGGSVISTYDDAVVCYRFQGEMPENVPRKFKIVTLFNWTEYPVEAGYESVSADALRLKVGETTIEDVCTHASAMFEALTISGAEDEWLDEGGRLIPFYGVREYDLDDYLTDADKTADGAIKGGTLINLSMKGSERTPLPLLRALAKVEVILDYPDASFEEVSMTRVNRKGFCAPYRTSTPEKVWNFDYTDYLPENMYTWANTFVRGVHLTYGATAQNRGGGTNDAGLPMSLPFKKVTDRKVIGDGAGGTTLVPERWVAYVPEYRNIGVEDFTSVRVRLKRPATAADVDESVYEKEIYFAENGKKDGVRFDIERNNIYRFTVSSLAANVDVSVDVQPFSDHKIAFEFGLMRDDRGDLMILPVQATDADGNPIFNADGTPKMTYPQYFIDFINDDNPKHKYPQEEDESGNPTTGENIRLEEGDYYAIVVGEYDEMSDAVVWVKDKDGCHVLSNFGSNQEFQECSARLVEAFFGNNQSEKFMKDIFGYRRVYHFDNHNSIVIHPKNEKMLFCFVENFMQENQVRRYYEVESWDETTATGWIINKNDAGEEVGFQEIKPDGTLGQTILSEEL